MTKVSIKTEATALALIIDSFFLLLEHLLYIYHPVHFKKDQAKIQVLFNFNSKINTITLVYAAKLWLKV